MMRVVMNLIVREDAGRRKVRFVVVLRKRKASFQRGPLVVALVHDVESRELSGEQLRAEPS